VNIPLSTEERARLIEGLSTEARTALDDLTDALLKSLHKQTAEQEPVEAPIDQATIANAATADSLDMVEITALYLIGRLARGRWLSRLDLEGGGLDGLYRLLLASLRELLPYLDIAELDQIHKRLVGQVQDDMRW
jgi:hypothetical protein